VTAFSYLVPNFSTKVCIAVAAVARVALRASEVTHLKVGDIDSDRMRSRVEQGMQV
jgi:hypothetical protein